MRDRLKKLLLVSINILVAVYLVLATTAFNKPDNRHQVCTEVKVTITDNVVDGFLSDREIRDLLKRHKLYPLGEQLNGVDVRRIEDVLRRSPFVDRAECYKTQSGKVCITLTQRMPIIRVMANNGDDYYVDNKGGVMPNVKYVGNLIVATGNINQKYAKKVLTPIGNHLISDKFWHQQIEQLHVLNDGSIEMVPRVGSHVVYLGQAVGIPEKLKRLYKFYRYGLSKAGWNRYSVISLEFDNQIICKKRKHIKQS